MMNTFVSGRWILDSEFQTYKCLFFKHLAKLKTLFIYTQRLIFLINTRYKTRNTKHTFHKDLNGLKFQFYNSLCYFIIRKNRAHRFFYLLFALFSYRFVSNLNTCSISRYQFAFVLDPLSIFHL